MVCGWPLTTAANSVCTTGATGALPPSDGGSSHSSCSISNEQQGLNAQHELNGQRLDAQRATFDINTHAPKRDADYAKLGAGEVGGRRFALR